MAAKMMKLVLLVLFSTLCSVQPFFTGKTILALYYENSTATFMCAETNTIWKIDDKNLTECNCPGKCGDVLFDKTRISAYCNGSNPVLHFKQMKRDDNFKHLKCADETSSNLITELRLLVGSKRDVFYAEEPVALVNNNYTLVCKKKLNHENFLYYDTKIIASVATYDGNPGYIENFYKENFAISVDGQKIILLIKNIALKDDGKIFACFSYDYSPPLNPLSLLTLTVNVPVSYVSLTQETNDVLIEDDYREFVCNAFESKPKASFQWILYENGSEREITENIVIASEQNGKVWQTNSTLKLKLKRSFKAIKCRARIQGTAWTNSTSLSLDVTYPPPGKLLLIVGKFKICVGESIKIKCEWKGGHPNASVKLTCLSKSETKNDSVTITEIVTREMSNDCLCEGEHVAGSMRDRYDISIEYPPNKVVIHQTSYLKGKPSSLICDASGGSPDIYTYSWSPGIYPPQKEININLTQVADQEFTCTVAYKCGGGNLKSSPKKIIIEDPPPGKPVIKVNNSKICVGEQVNITCEWRGGNPSASVNLTCLSVTKTNKDDVTIIIGNVTREMSNLCRCEGEHVAKNASSAYDISIEYPPNQVVINQTSYLKGKPSSLICDASGGSPDVYTYSWSPGNYPPQKEININLTQVSDQEFTCIVAHKCGGGNLKSAPTKIIVEAIEDESDDNIWVIVAPTVAALIIIIIAGAIIFFKYRSYSMNKKAANKIPPLPTQSGKPKFVNGKASKIFTRPPTLPKLEDETTENIYDDIEMK